MSQSVHIKIRMALSHPRDHLKKKNRGFDLKSTYSYKSSGNPKILGWYFFFPLIISPVAIFLVMMYQIDERLKQAFPERCKEPFGGISVVLMG